MALKHVQDKTGRISNCVHAQVLHSLSKERLELVNSLEPYVRERVVPLLKPVDKCWQPADYLPDPSKGDYLDQVSASCSGNLSCWTA